MSILHDLKAYGVTVTLSGESLKIAGLDKVSEKDRPVVSMLLKEAHSRKEDLIKEIQGTFIQRSYEARVEVNKAFAGGESLEHIASILLRVVADLTGDQVFEIQNIKALHKRMANQERKEVES